MPESSQARAILLSGTVGSGKTRILLELGELLEEQSESYALVDLDWLAWCRPRRPAAPTVHEILVRNLTAAWGTFRGAGIERLVLARDIREPAHVPALRAALPEVELAVVELRAPLRLVEERLRQRDTGRELAEHLAEARRGAAAPMPVADATVDNGGRPARTVALEVLAASGW
ncbi:MAG: hypothetical protein IT201_04140 [Thermoleophilia bacterium]|nr:hypothetical protein [Thermoleophilia bacterium]